jgi:hypothetical protein
MDSLARRSLPMVAAMIMRSGEERWLDEREERS